MRRRYFWILWVVVLLIGLMLGVLVVLARLGAKRAFCVTVLSEPSRATVFDEQGQVGVTPIVVELQPHERRLLRLVKKGYADADAALVADALLPQSMAASVRRYFRPDAHEVFVTMQPLLAASITVTSVPSGAQVLLDGRSVGMTPFSQQAFAAGTHTLRLVHPDCFPVEKTIDVISGEAFQVHQILDNKVVALYRSLIEKEPGVLTHHAELAHYFVLEAQFSDAADALRDGYEAAKRDDASREDLYFAEMLRIYIRQYEYPPERDGDEVRPVCMELMQRAVEEQAWQVKVIDRYLKQMRSYEKKHRRR